MKIFHDAPFDLVPNHQQPIYDCTYKQYQWEHSHEWAYCYESVALYSNEIPMNLKEELQLWIARSVGLLRIDPQL